MFVHRSTLWTQKGQLKLADFGLARAFGLPVRSFSHEVLFLDSKTMADRECNRLLRCGTVHQTFYLDQRRTPPALTCGLLVACSLRWAMAALLSSLAPQLLTSWP